MLLKRLAEYDEREGRADPDVLPPEYARKAPDWLVALDRNGTFQALVSLKADKKDRAAARALALPFLKRSGTSIKPTLLADTAEFVFGVSETAPARAAARSAEFQALVEACATTTNDEAVAAVQRFLASAPPQLPSDMKDRDLVYFMVDGSPPTASLPVQEFWGRLAPRLRNRGLPPLTTKVLDGLLLEGPGDAETTRKCMLCGETRPIARIHPVPIQFPRPVADQQLAIVSANKDSFSSYGLEQSRIAPMCVLCAAAYANGLNRLAHDRSTRHVVGKAIFVFWTRAPDAGTLNLISKPSPGDVDVLIDAIQTGKQPGLFDGEAFYAACFSASGARVVVRDWIDTTVGNAERTVARWFSLQRLEGYGRRLDYLGLDGLTAATVRRPTSQTEWNDLPAAVSTQLHHAAWTEQPIPADIFASAVRRAVTEGRPRRECAALIKAALLSRHSQQPLHASEDRLYALDPDLDDKAYQCGRLLAVLDRIQETAIPTMDDSSRVGTKWFATAAVTPFAAFPPLIARAFIHLGTIARFPEPERREAAKWLRNDLNSIHNKIKATRSPDGTSAPTGFPTRLDLEGQGRFVLGFFHQDTYRRTGDDT